MNDLSVPPVSQRLDEAPADEGEAPADANVPADTRNGWLLRLTVGPPPAVAQWENQWRQLRPQLSFDPVSCTWTALLGALDQDGLAVLRTCFASARDHHADVRVDAVPAPDGWLGRVFAQAPCGTRRGAGAVETAGP